MDLNILDTPDSLPVTVALRHVLRRRRQTFLSLLAVGLAVSISIMFSSLINGQQQILTNLVEEKMPHVVVEPRENEEFIHLYKSLLDRIASQPGIRSAAPTLTTPATLSRKDKSKNALLKGSDPLEIDRIYRIQGSLLQGDFINAQQEGFAAIGVKLANSLQLRLGDQVQATFPRSHPLDLKVAAIFQTGTPLDERVAFVSLGTSRSFKGEGDVINAVDISLDDIRHSGSLASLISSWGYNARSWEEKNPEIMRAINIGGFWTGLSILLFMVVAFFGVASIMNLMVVEKTREIGMLMAMGARPKDIRNIFLAESSLLGFLGAAAGSVVGVVGVHYLGRVPFEVAAGGSVITTLPLILNPWDILLLDLLVIALSIVAALYPARRASRIDPVIALRGG
ncbi:MAG TPA: FtsX-like permease family protein [Methanothrix sp.]|jgi:lipoprotein-releasing system permease protein|uniref:ABC transporter permease n=1 Tax=Methanothrix sp. TaxID=90426 RepID=UPI002CD7E20E|nr:FtsX-like permease family protein [Methanothrix sp.]MDI9417005.1 FtsX-like permease family protein [Euryarchaeota archaeon]HON35383.1 FtsX-like permease family protein [Methanothrix sp.]HRU76132.1 FtsX-like permease family protein [Methanothrix sp.]